jgi:hypothetical protein
MCSIVDRSRLVYDPALLPLTSVASFGIRTLTFCTLDRFTLPNRRRTAKSPTTQTSFHNIKITTVQVLSFLPTSGTRQRSAPLAQCGIGLGTLTRGD